MHARERSSPKTTINLLTVVSSRAFSQPGEPRGMWTSNRLCEAAILQRKADIHRERLRNIKCSIDSRDPRRPPRGNSKGARLEEEKNAQIMHENTILLDKLSKILTREKGAQAGGAVLPAVARPPTSGGGLHDIYRRKQREQIDHDNQQLLKRLQYMKPSIDMLAFEQQWQQSAHFAIMGRSHVGNPMMAPASPKRGQARPQTVPSGHGRRPAPAGAPQPMSSKQHMTPSHYLQPLDQRGKATAPDYGGSDYDIASDVASREADAVMQAALGSAGD